MNTEINRVVEKPRHPAVCP